MQMETKMQQMPRQLTEILGSLTEEQRAAALHLDGPAVVIAGAGSGKTSTLRARVANLVMGCAVDARRVLAVTFSRTAAQELTNRIGALGVRCNASTWHALAFNISRWEGIFGRNISDDAVDAFGGRTKAAIRQACEQHAKRVGEWREIDVGFAQAYIDRAKAKLLLPTPDDYDAAAALAGEMGRVFGLGYESQHFVADVLAVYEAAETLRVERGIIGFADMLCHAARLLRDDAQARARWAAKYDYVLVDEAQDNDDAQILIQRALTPTNNLMLIGDVQQSIYGFRGARPDTMIEFAQAEDTTIYKLSANFRSLPHIVAAGNALSTSMGLAEDVLLAMTPVRDALDPVEDRVMVSRASNPTAEAAEIIEELRKATAYGIAPHDIAVLVRTSGGAAIIEDAIIDSGVPYYLATGSSFYSRKEIKTLLSYLACIVGRHDLDDVERACKAPTRYVGAATANAIAEEAVKPEPASWVTCVQRALRVAPARGSAPELLIQWARMIDQLALVVKTVKKADDVRMEDGEILDESPIYNAAHALAEIVQRTGYLRWLRRDEGASTADDDRVENVNRLIARAGRIGTIDQLLDFAQLATERATTKRPEGRVWVGTIHRAKGLEWDTVFCPQWVEETLPHARALESDNEAEERRLAYVAVTRARNRLYISHTVARGLNPEALVQATPSRYLDIIAGESE